MFLFLGELTGICLFPFNHFYNRRNRTTKRPTVPAMCTNISGNKVIPDMRP